MQITLDSEKMFHIKNPKLNIFSSKIKYDVGNQIKYTCIAQSSSTKRSFHEQIFFFGMSNGQILRIRISRQKTLYSNYERLDVLTFQCYDNVHSGPISQILSKEISDEEIIFSAGADSRIKLWKIDIDEFNQFHYYRTFPSDICHVGSVIDIKFVNSENILISCGTDVTIRFFKINIIMKNNIREFEPSLTNVIKKFPDVPRNIEFKSFKLNTNIYLITCLSIREEDVIQLYAGDSLGNVHIFEMYNPIYESAKSSEKRKHLGEKMHKRNATTLKQNETNKDKESQNEEVTNTNIINSINDINRSKTINHQNLFRISSENPTIQQSSLIPSSTRFRTKKDNFKNPSLNLPNLHNNFVSYRFEMKKSKRLSSTKKSIIDSNIISKKQKLFYLKSSHNVSNFEIIEIFPAPHETLFYSISNSRKIIGYSSFENKITFIIGNMFKGYYSCLFYNDINKDLLLGDNTGNILFIEMFTKTQIKIKDDLNSKVLSIKPIKLFIGSEFEDQRIIVLTCDSFCIFKLKKETRSINKLYHEDQIIKLIALDPIVEKRLKYCKRRRDSDKFDIQDYPKILEDFRVISASYDNNIKIWDIYNMNLSSTIKLPNQNKNITLEISSVNYMPISDLLVIGTDLGEIFFYNLFRKCYISRSIFAKSPHKDRITYICRSINKKNSEIALICSKDGIISIWQMEQIEELKALKKFNLDKFEGKIKFIDNHFPYNTIIEPKLLEKLPHEEFKDLIEMYKDLIFEKHDAKSNSNNFEKINRNKKKRKNKNNSNSSFYRLEKLLNIDNNLGIKKGINPKIISDDENENIQKKAFFDSQSLKNINILPKLNNTIKLSDKHREYDYSLLELNCICHSSLHNSCIAGGADSKIHIYNEESGSHLYSLNVKYINYSRINIH